jgi:hypothetical protein
MPKIPLANNNSLSTFGVSVAINLNKSARGVCDLINAIATMQLVLQKTDPSGCYATFTFGAALIYTLGLTH